METIGKNNWGEERNQVMIQEYEGNQSTKNKRNQTVSIYDEDFDEVRNIVDSVVGDLRNIPKNSRKRVKVTVRKMDGNNQTEKAHVSSAYETSVTEVRDLVIPSLEEKFSN